MKNEVDILQEKIEYEKHEIRECKEHIDYLKHEIERNMENVKKAEFKICMHNDVVAYLENEIESLEK